MTKLAFIFTVLCLPFEVLAQQKNLTPQQQAEFLAKRTDGPIDGTFDSVCSSLYAWHSVAIHTRSDRINRTKLVSRFVPFYQPTWKEIFDLIAWQTRSRWTYDPAQGYWVFEDVRPPMPYKLKVAPGWKPEDHEIEVVYRPPKLAPVGMDVYSLGSYSSDDTNSEKALFERVREELAMHFVRGYVEGVRPQHMRKARIGKVECLYYSTKSGNGQIWRQWVMVEKGRGLAIVSSISPEHEKETAGGRTGDGELVRSRGTR